MTFNPKWIIGRKIVAVDMNPFEAAPETPSANRTVFDPVFTLDNGARVKFLTTETEVGEYGIDVIYMKPLKTKKGEK